MGLARLAIVLATGCGRIGFSSATDAPAPISAVAGTASSTLQSGALSYGFVVPPTADRWLAVSVHIGGQCFDTSTPSVAAVTYATRPLERLAMILGTPCGATVTRSELWQMVDPPIGSAAINVQLDGTADTIQSGAIAIAGVDLAQPIRNMQTASGTGGSSSLAIASEPGDLVVDFVGQGSFIVSPIGPDVPIFVHDVSNRTTLDNAAAVARIAGEASVSMGWLFDGDDEWQELAAALRPR